MTVWRDSSIHLDKAYEHPTGVGLHHIDLMARSVGNLVDNDESRSRSVIPQ